QRDRLQLRPASLELGSTLRKIVAILLPDFRYGNACKVSLADLGELVAEDPVGPPLIGARYEPTIEQREQCWKSQVPPGPTDREQRVEVKARRGGALV